MCYFQLHFVHARDELLSNIDHIYQSSDGLAVIGVMLEVGAVYQRFHFFHRVIES